MADETPQPNILSGVGQPRSTARGDVPERLLARYYVEHDRTAWRFYVDAQIDRPVFQDRGRSLVSARSDPNAVRDMTAIAAHRGWRLLEARGAPSFRREAWLAGRTLDIEVRGYRPSERDLQELARRRDNRERLEAKLSELQHPPTPRQPAPVQRDLAERLKVAEALVRTRIPDPAVQERLLNNARRRIADWLERGARFEPVRTSTVDRDGRERRRAR